MRLRTWVYVCAAALLCIPATAFGVTRGEALSLAKEIGGAVGDDFDVVFPTEYTASAWSGGYSIQPRGYYDIANGEPDAKHAAVLLQLITNEIIGPNEIRRLGMILSNMGTDAALPAADLLGDGREKVRWAGATVLSIMGSHATPALSALQSRLADSNETARVRVMAARAIAEITGEDVFALHATVPGIDDLLQAEVTQSIEDTNSDAVWQAYLAGTLEETFTPRGFYYYNGGNVDSYRAFYQLATGTDLEEANQYVRENISGTYNQFTGAKATDRNISTDSRWQPTGAAESMTFDYGQVVTFNTARIHFYKSDLLTADFELQVSTDGVNFEPALAETTSSINPEGECETFTFPDKDGRYLRCVYYSNSENNNNLNGVIELVAYGPAGTELEPPTFTDVTASDNDWVWRGNPDTPQPEAEELWVKNQETDGSARFTFLRFDVSSLPEGVLDPRCSSSTSRSPSIRTINWRFTCCRTVSQRPLGDQT